MKGKKGELEKLNAALRAAHVGLWGWDLSRNDVVYSAEWKRQLGHEEHEISNDFNEWKSRLHPDDLEPTMAKISRFVENPHPNDYVAEFRMRHKDGSYRWILAQAAVEHDDHGRVLRMLGSHVDITDRKRMETSLREREAELEASEKRLRSLTDASPHMIHQLAVEGSVSYTNQYWRDYFGRETLTMDQWPEIVHPDDLASGSAHYEVMQSAEMSAPARLRRHDGSYRWFVSRTLPIFDAAGRLQYIVGSAVDVDDLKRAQDALRDAQVRLVTALRAARMGTWHYDLYSDHLRADESLVQLFGRSSRELEQLSMEDALSLVHPDDRKGITAAARRALEDGAELSVEARALLPDGTTPWHAIEGRVVRDSAGQITALMGANVDITHRKQLEDQLRQAQKMEAVGQLAGGIAHDFNNLLMVILGQASLLELEAGLGPTATESLRQIAHAAQRAAHLTAQLLAFGRRQVLQARDLDLNELLARDMQLLVRTLGEDITCVFERAPAAALVHVDPSMLTQVLLNLAVNARDAMPQGGTLTIQVCFERLAAGDVPVSPEQTRGDYVCLVVSDSGSGIADDALPHVFEPFFTTKMVGQGTGLGLAMVYGIVKQHHGFIQVETALEKGTTFKIAFPRLEAASTPAEEHARATFAEGRGETILLIEDEAMVRSLLKTVLEQHNYRLIAVENGAQAYEVWRERGREVELLLTDLVLPGGISGQEIAATLRASKPGLKIIMSSGYSPEIYGHEKASEDGARFLQKPYDPPVLLAEVRSALDERG